MNRRSPSRALLRPLALLWPIAARFRAFAYRARLLRAKRLPGTVISVGNLTTGGTGKTPVVLWIAERLHSEGKRVAVLTRGYRSRSAVPAGTPRSDEVAIYRERLAGRAELGVGANRYETGLTLAKHGVEWFVLDDGFQHLQLTRNADIVLLDSTDPFGAGGAWPRESKSALARADVVVITRTSHAPALEEIARRYIQAPVFYATMEWDETLAVANQSVAGSARNAASNWRARKAFAFCAVGNPAAFFDDLKRWGATVVGSAEFPDHHFFTLADAAQIAEQAAAAGAEILLCTEKDVFNLQEVWFSLPAYFIRANIQFADPEGFWRAVHDAMQRKH